MTVIDEAFISAFVLSFCDFPGDHFRERKKKREKGVCFSGVSAKHADLEKGVKIVKTGKGGGGI